MAHFDNVEGIKNERLRAAIEKADAMRPRKGDSSVTRARKARTARQPQRAVTNETLELEVPCKPWSLNEERSLHFSERATRTEAVRLATALLVPRDAGRFDVPVEIEATPLGVRFDVGNAYPAIKAAIDGIVDSGVLTDDDPRYVARLIFNAPASADQPGLILTVRAMRED